jgi:hypothetical protein
MVSMDVNTTPPGSATVYLLVDTYPVWRGPLP